MSPWAPLKACAVPGCPNRVVKGRCPEHARTSDRQYNARHDRNAGDPRSTARWRKIRAAYLFAHPTCECGQHDDLPPFADDVHHRVALEDGGDPFDVTNLMAVARACHNKLTAAERMARAKEQEKP